MKEKTREALKHNTMNLFERRKIKLRRLLGLVLSVFLTVSSLILLKTVTAQEPLTTILTDPLMVQVTNVGQVFTVNINVSDVTDLYAWQTGITFNSEVLECTGFHEGEFLERSGGKRIFLEHGKDMDNAVGIVYFRGCCLLGSVPGVDGSGQLAYTTFKSVGIGVSDFHLTDIVLINSKLEDIKFRVAEVFTVQVYELNYQIGIINNLTGIENSPDSPLSGTFNTTLSVHDKNIGFDVLTTEDWFCGVNIPKALLKGDWTIKVDGASLPYTTAENGTHTSLHFEYGKGSHTVEITGTGIVNGMPGDFTQSLLLAVTVALIGLATLTVALRDFEKTRKIIRNIPARMPTWSSLLVVLSYINDSKWSLTAIPFTVISRNVAT